MRIESARWTAQVNKLFLRCDCGELFEHRADRWNATCPKCGKWGHLNAIRDEWVSQQTALRGLAPQKGGVET